MLHILKQMNGNVAMLYYFGFCTYHGSLEAKCLVNVVFENNIPSSLNLTDNVSKNKNEITTFAETAKPF